MYHWIAILAALALAIGAAYGQSSSPAQPALPLGQSHMMESPMTHGSGMGMDQSMMPMMQMMQMMHLREAGMGPAMMGQGETGMMMCRGQMGAMGMEGSPESHLEARLAFAKSELAIDQAQEAAWQAYAMALRAEARSMPTPTPTHRHGIQHAMASDLAFPARLDARLTMLESEMSRLKAVRDEATVLYQQLNTDQTRKADRLLAMSLCM